MSRYIDADVLIDDLIHNRSFYPAIVASAIKNIPTADIAEARHGHWITEKEALEIDRYDLAFTCSVCGRCDWDCTESESFNYCPNCGAKMDGERKEDGT
jgi:rubrerythrin